MRKIVLICLLFLAIPQFAHSANTAKGSKPNWDKLFLSYDQVKTLPLADQKKYFHAVADLIYGLEAVQKYPEGEVASTNNLRFLKAFLETAEAADKGVCIFAGFASQYGPSVLNPAKTVCQAAPQSQVGCNAPHTYKCNLFGLDGFALFNNKDLCQTLDKQRTLTSRCQKLVNDAITNLTSLSKATDDGGKANYAQAVNKAKEAIDSLDKAGVFANCQVNHEKQKGGECATVEKYQSTFMGLYAGLPASAAPASTLATVVATAQNVNPCKDMSGVSCVTCVLENKYKKPVAAKYLNLIEIMAKRCSKVYGNKDLAGPDLTKGMAQIIQSVGYCSDYSFSKNGKQTDKENTLSQPDIDKVIGEKHPDLEFKFQKAFGLHLLHFNGSADSVFCSDAKASSGERQAQYEKEMARNRVLTNDGAWREESGWEQCDAQIQMRQGRQYLSGMRPTLAKKYSKGADGKVVFTNSSQKEDDNWKMEYRTVKPTQNIEDAMPDLQLLKWDHMCTEKDCQAMEVTSNNVAQDQSLESQLAPCYAGASDSVGASSKKPAKTSK